MRSSAKPFRAPSSRDRRRNSGCIRFICTEVSRMERGTVTKNTTDSVGDSHSSMTKEPATVRTLVQICRRSVDREVFTVSTS